MAKPTNLFETATAHLSRCDNVLSVIFCVSVYSKWLNFPEELDFCASAETKLREIINKQNGG